jgi:lysophospholipase L1-like esterase
LTFGSALIVATCSVGRDRAALPPVPANDPTGASTEAAPGPPIAATELATASSPVPTASASPPIAEPSSSSSAAVATIVRPSGQELPNFYAALRSLEQHTRASHVRVAWLGDSHGAADLWSGPLRSALQAKFGDGGPGFVHVGYKSYRHDGVHIEIKGRWAVTPRGPSTGVRTGDGTFGLGGVVLSGSADDPHATLTVTDTALPATLLWDLCYKLGAAHDELSIGVTGQTDRALKAAPGETLGVLRHVTFTSAGASPALRVMPTGGQPGLCGVTIETDPKTQPGVVLDTLGINGARLITPLAWNEDAWVAELARRPPSLVVVEYGTNESGDHVIHPEAFVENLKRLLARVRAASPSCDCLVLAPTDRADTEDRTPLVRDALRDAAKTAACGFWDTYAAMGGRGSITAWHNETPPRAAGDGVHLSPRGYKDLGDRLAAEVLAGYKP